MELLESSCEVSYWKDNSVIPTADLITNIQGKDALFCLLTDKVDKEVLDVAENLKVVATMSVGFDHLDVETLKAKNVLVGYTPGVLTDSTADLTVSLLLATSRRLVEGSQALRSGDWAAWSPLWLCGPELAGSTVGIVGLGQIGKAVMNRLKPFGVSRFVYHGRSRRDAGYEEGAEFLGFDDLLSVSDFVLVTCSYSPDLHHKFDKTVFKKMKNNSILINTSRGGIINQDDLVEALKNKEIFAAGLDVMTPEPLPTSHPLTTLENCVLIPHLGSATIQTRTIMAKMTVENILAGLTGNTMPAKLV
jgi:glyoxylate/hydroxypyruvate reductase